MVYLVLPNKMALDKQEKTEKRVQNYLNRIEKLEINDSRRGMRSIHRDNKIELASLSRISILKIEVMTLLRDCKAHTEEIGELRPRNYSIKPTLYPDLIMS